MQSRFYFMIKMYMPYHLNTFFAKLMTFGSEFLNFRFFQWSGQVMSRVSRSPRSQYKILARNTHHLVLSFYLYIFSIYILYIYILYIYSLHNSMVQTKQILSWDPLLWTQQFGPKSFRAASKARIRDYHYDNL